jgi:toxin ParE1/3/4
MPIFWHAAARGDFRAIRRFYRDLDPGTLDRLLAAIFETARHLEAHPNIGRPGRVEGTRELPVKGTRFLLAYTVGSDRLVILCVYHSARRWPETWLRAHVEESLRQAKDGQFASDEEVWRAFESFGDGEPPEASDRS